MILSEIRDYLQTHKRAALKDMAHRFNTEPDALRGMLDKWIAKGRVEKLPQGTPCSGCTQCDPGDIEIYVWKETPRVQ
ncbi:MULTISPECIES: FeoC-like transcriptional regulator [unclassified Hahella]|uniref:FeoC-like transcriptional regulator n=1 Tax=unclassified Hahella TaxID=2624107 RepID=UPI001C1E8E11|nr:MULTISPECIES: FeoC-like transcriptional regulator [unclassified Hahella]MBU6953637.1 FeoC-like transcriptional regulator [Hahella sp. HN01]MDG9672143.1 FeoC-like transcriptional regulator [Hahella sp. CR1]